MRIVDHGRRRATVVSRSYLGGTTRLGLDVEGQRINALRARRRSRFPPRARPSVLGFADRATCI